MPCRLSCTDEVQQEVIDGDKEWAQVRKVNWQNRRGVPEHCASWAENSTTPTIARKRIDRIKRTPLRLPQPGGFADWALQKSASVIGEDNNRFELAV